MRAYIPTSAIQVWGREHIGTFRSSGISLVDARRVSVSVRLLGVGRVRCGWRTRVE